MYRLAASCTGGLGFASIFHRVTLAEEQKKQYVLVGQYNTTMSHVVAQGQGIAVMEFDKSSGALRPVGAADEKVTGINPTCLIQSGSEPVIYATNEWNGVHGKEGGVTSLRFDKETGTLEKLTSKAAFGGSTCALTFVGPLLFAPNYMTGSVVGFYLNRQDGSLGDLAQFIQHPMVPTNPQVLHRQECSHPHSLVKDPHGDFVIVPDLGLDQLLIYRVDATSGKLELTGSVTTPPGSGPRHGSFSADGTRLYISYELGNQVGVFNWDRDSATLQASHPPADTLPAGFTEFSHNAEVRIHPNGKFLYVSNRGHHSIAIFKILVDGNLEAVGQEPTGGATPRHFTFDPSGQFLLVGNQDSHNIVTFRICPKTGRLARVQEVADVGSPVWLHFVRD